MKKSELQQRYLNKDSAYKGKTTYVLDTKNHTEDNILNTNHQLIKYWPTISRRLLFEDVCLLHSKYTLPTSIVCFLSAEDGSIGCTQTLP